MLVAWVATVYGLWQLIQLHEIQGSRFNRYHELGQYALGVDGTNLLTVHLQTWLHELPLLGCTVMLTMQLNIVRLCAKHASNS